MAEVRLGRLEAEEGELPPLCLRCGAPATMYNARRLAWQPGWVVVLFALTFWPLLVMSLLIRKRMRLLAPFCHAHRNYWRRRFLIAATVYGGLAGFVMAGFMLLVVAQADGRTVVNPLLPFWFIGLYFLAAIFLVQLGSIRATEITDDSIALTGVAAEFVNHFRKEKQDLLHAIQGGKGRPAPPQLKQA